MADSEKQFRDESIEHITKIFVNENNTLNKKIKKEKRDAIENRKKYFAAKKFMNTNHTHHQEKLARKTNLNQNAHSKLCEEDVDHLKFKKSLELAPLPH